MDRGRQRKTEREIRDSQGRGVQRKGSRRGVRSRLPLSFLASGILLASFCPVCVRAETLDAEIYQEDRRGEIPGRELFEKEISDAEMPDRRMHQEEISGRDLPGQDMPGEGTYRKEEMRRKEETYRKEAEKEKEEGVTPQEGPFPEEILEYSAPENSREKLQEPQQLIERGGKTYRLSSWETVKEEKDKDRQYREASVVYELVGAEAEIPDEAEITVEGLTEKVKMPLLRTEFYNERWEPDFECILTFHSCESDVYELGETEIYADHRAEKPALGQFEEEILGLLGLSGERYRILEYQWAGEPYEDETGILCRKARASGERLVRDCRAVYGGMTDMEPPPSYRTKAVYVLERKMVPETAGGEEKAESMEGQREPDRDSLEDSLKEKLVKVVTVTVAVTVGIGTILIFLVILRFVWRTGRSILEQFFDSH